MLCLLSFLFILRDREVQLSGYQYCRSEQRQGRRRHLHRLHHERRSCSCRWKNRAWRHAPSGTPADTSLFFIAVMKTPLLLLFCKVWKLNRTYIETTVFPFEVLWPINNLSVAFTSITRVFDTSRNSASPFPSCSFLPFHLCAATPSSKTHDAWLQFAVIAPTFIL